MSNSLLSVVNHIALKSLRYLLSFMLIIYFNQFHVSRDINIILLFSDSQGKFGLIEMDESDARNNIQTGNIVLHDVAVQVGIDFSTGEIRKTNIHVFYKTSLTF